MESREFYLNMADQAVRRRQAREEERRIHQEAISRIHDDDVADFVMLADQCTPEDHRHLNCLPFSELVELFKKQHS